MLVADWNAAEAVGHLYPLPGSTVKSCPRLKHPIDHIDVKVHMPFQAGAKAVDESDLADVQRHLVQLLRPRAFGLQALREHPQKDPQHHVEHWAVALPEVAQSLRHRQHPLTHRQAGEDVIRQVRRRLRQYSPAVLFRTKRSALMR